MARNTVKEQKSIWRITVIKIYNVITPNGDGKNDVLDLSALGLKDNVKFILSDRFGKILFDGKLKDNFSWDGTINNRKVPTGTYWYYLEWQEPNSGITQIYKGWILVKNY